MKHGHAPGLCPATSYTTRVSLPSFSSISVFSIYTFIILSIPDQATVSLHLRITILPKERAPRLSALDTFVSFPFRAPTVEHALYGVDYSLVCC